MDLDKEKEVADSPKVKDFLTEEVIAFGLDFTLVDILKNFNKYRISSAPVVNDEWEVIGFLSEKDFIKCLSNNLFYDESQNCNVEAIMSKSVETANGDWDVFELVHLFLEKNLRSVPVVDSKNHLLGIVTRRDALKALEKLMDGFEEHKSELKTPFELNLKEQVNVIINTRKFSKESNDNLIVGIT